MTWFYQKSICFFARVFGVSLSGANPIITRVLHGFSPGFLPGFLKTPGFFASKKPGFFFGKPPGDQYSWRDRGGRGGLTVQPPPHPHPRGYRLRSLTLNCVIRSIKLRILRKYCVYSLQFITQFIAKLRKLRIAIMGQQQ